MVDFQKYLDTLKNCKSCAERRALMQKHARVYGGKIQFFGSQFFGSVAEEPRAPLILPKKKD